MIALIKAELRKNWKTRKFIIAVLCFLCFMGCAYTICLQKQQQYYDDETLVLDYEKSVSGSTIYMIPFKQAEFHQQTPKEIQEELDVWWNVANGCLNYALLRQAPDYFGKEEIMEAAIEHNQAVYAARTSSYYENQLEESGRSLQDVIDQKNYYTYLEDHEIMSYQSPYEPNLLNFGIQLFQNELIILLIALSAFFIIDQVCQDFDTGSYKNVYTTPMQRSKIMSAKVISAILMIVTSFVIAFLCFSWIPLMTYGVGSYAYPYIANHQLITYLPLLCKIVPFMLLVILFYMSVCVLIASIFKNTTNSLLFLAGVLLIVYLSVQYFGIHLPFLTWLPFFYLYPMDILMGSYDYSLWVCVGCCVIAILLIYALFHKWLEKSDLKGSEAS